MTPPRSRVLYIRVPAPVHDAVRELALDLGVSMTDAIALSLRLLLLPQVRDQVAESILLATLTDRQAPLAHLQPRVGRVDSEQTAPSLPGNESHRRT